MRYHLRTLLIVLAVMPALLAGAWFAYLAISDEIAYADWEYHWKPFLALIGGLVGLIALTTAVAALTQFSNRSL
jgi:hypothetical protein